jgi:hypothetical protein
MINSKCFFVADVRRQAVIVVFFAVDADLLVLGDRSLAGFE